MPISITCPNPSCEKNISVPEEYDGRRVRCKQCGQSFIATSTMDARKNVTQSKPSSSESPDQPMIVGRFEIRSTLGSGGFGTVYRAYDPQLDREVALKIPNPGTLDNPKSVERFLREAKATAALRHPHIVPVFDAGKDGIYYFIASAFIAGRKLSNTIEENGTEFKRAARLVRELAEALAYAHDQGIVHRDVKPDNIMIDKNDHVHLMDFGLASRLNDESRLTRDGAVLGTPLYMAPEQAKGQEGEAKPASDQYSAGIILYELLCGKVPFEGRPAIVIHHQIHTQPDVPSTFRKKIPQDLETICLKAISKRPSDRYPDCQALADDLRRWQECEPIFARKLTPFERLKRWTLKNKGLAIVSVSGISILILGIVVSLFYAAKAKRAAEAEKERARELQVALQKAQEAEENTKIALENAQHLNANYNVLLAGSANTSELGQQFLSLVPEKYRKWEWHHLRKQIQGGLFPLFGHTSGVHSVSWSPDGSRIVSGSSDQTLRIWDAKTGESLMELKGHKLYVDSVSWSPDGSRIVSGSQDKTLRIWDAKTGKSLTELKGHTWGVSSVSWSPDGSRIISSGMHPDIFRVWDGIPINWDDPSKDELNRRRRLMRPDPDWHFEQMKKAEREKDPVGLAHHRKWYEKYQAK